MGLAIGIACASACGESMEREEPTASAPDSGAMEPDAATPPPETPPPSTPDEDASITPVDDASVPPAPPPPPATPPPPPVRDGLEWIVSDRDEVVEQTAIAATGSGYGVVWRSVERDAAGDVVRIRFAALDATGAPRGRDTLVHETVVGPDTYEGAYLSNGAIAFDGTHFGLLFSERNHVEIGERIATFVRVTEDGVLVGEPLAESRTFYRGAWVHAVDDGFAVLIAEDFDTTITRIHGNGVVDAPIEIALDPSETVEASAWNGSDLALLVHRSTRVIDELTWWRHIALDGTTVGTPSVLAIDYIRQAETMTFTPYGSGYALLWHVPDETNPRRVGITRTFIEGAESPLVGPHADVATSTAWHRTVIAASPIIRDVVGVVWMGSDEGGYNGTPMFTRVGEGLPSVACRVQETPAHPDFDVFAVAVSCDAGLGCLAVWGDAADDATAERPRIGLRARYIDGSTCR